MAISRIRRVRSEPKKKAAPSKAQVLEQTERLNSIANMQRQIAALEKQKADEEATLFVFMNNNELDHLPGDECFADIKQSAGKATNTIDPKALRAKVKDDKEYYSCISVSVTRAKEVLSGKELAAITQHTPGTPGEKRLKVTLVEDK